MHRRRWLSGGVAVGAGALTACATPSATDAAARPVFRVTTPTLPTLPIVGSGDVFLVRCIYCIGRNYAAHAREMGSDPNREPPFFFQETKRRDPVGASGHHS